ncbi:MAG: STM4015 family protein [Kibdelosporangium sp.]
MGVYEHLQTFHGLKTARFGTEQAPAGEQVAWRLAIEAWDSDESFAELWDRFLSTVDTSGLTALVFGLWGEAGEDDTVQVAIDCLVAAKDRFPALTGIFLGDIVGEESEISWIKQDDITRVLTEFPALTELGVRGGDGLELAPVRHQKLRTLVIETGGLPREVVSAVGQSDFPALTELRLWFGVPEYGGNWQPEDLQPLLAGGKLPALRHLGLQNSEEQDTICDLVADAGIVRQLETLDLSMGVLRDPGARALLAGQSLTHLKTLDLTHHFLSGEVQQQVRDALEPAGVRVILEGGESPDIGDDKEVYYYTAVAE